MNEILPVNESYIHYFRYESSTVVVLAGYQAEMHHMLRLNPGLKGRFQEFIHFDDWTPEKCARFVETQMARAKPKEFCWQDGQDVACHQALMDGFAELSRRLEPGLYGWMVGWLVRWLVGRSVGGSFCLLYTSDAADE